MASIVKRQYTSKKTGITEIFYSISYRDIYGKQHLVGRYKSRYEAVKHLHEYEDNYGTEDNIILKEIFDLYWKKTVKYAKTTQYNYKVYYNRYFKDIEHKRYKKLSVTQLQSFFDDIEKDSKHSAKYCQKMFKAAINNAIKKQVIKENKLVFLDTIKIPKSRRKALNLQESTILLDYAKNNLKKRDYVIIYLFLGTGMREGEVFALNKSDIDLENFSLEVFKQYTKGELKFIPKSSTSNRTVYYFQDLADILEDYMNEVDGELLFPNRDGGFIDANNFRDRVWNKLMKKMDFNKHVCLHGLRKSYIDISISQNIPIKFIQNNVGHAKCEVTLDVYANNNAEMIVFAKQQMQYAFTSCYQNVIKKQKTEKSNVIPFPKRPSASEL